MRVHRCVCKGTHVHVREGTQKCEKEGVCMREHRPVFE